MPDPTYPLVLSPAQKARLDAENAEEARLGMRYNAIATLGGLICLVILLPYVGIGLGVWFTRKARRVGNPAVLGRIVMWVNIAATAVLVIVVIRLIVAISAAPTP